MKLTDLQEARYAHNPVIMWLDNTIEKNQHRQDDWAEVHAVKNPMRGGNVLGIYEYLSDRFGKPLKPLDPKHPADPLPILQTWWEWTYHAVWNIPDTDLIITLEIDGRARKAFLLVSNK
jgi:hypothetical protein